MWIDQPTFELPANVARTDAPNTWTGVQFFGDPVTIDSSLSALTIQGDGGGITGLNASELSTGTVPLGRLGTNSPSGTTFLRGDNTWQTALTEAQVRAIACKAPFYPAWTPAGIDDEFDDESFSGWTRVDKPAGPVLVLTEANDRLSIKHPGGDGNSELHAFLKSYTLAVGDWWELCHSAAFQHENHFVVGVMLTDGTTYGSGSQWAFTWNFVDNNIGYRTFTGFNNNPGFANMGTLNYYSPKCPVMIRMHYVSANNWDCLVSTDGITYAKLNNTYNSTLSFTPTHAGFFLTTWGGTQQRHMSVLYYRKGNG